MAGTTAIDEREPEARRIFSVPTATAACVIDTARGSSRIVLRDADQIIAALFVARTPIAVMRDYLATLPGTDIADALTGRVPASTPNPGPTLCSCFGVGMNTIVTAIETDGLMTVEQIGEALRAGTNCGSCRPEIADLLARVRVKEAVE